MKKKLTFILLSLLLINLFNVSAVWAKHGFKEKHFLPPGLQKKYEQQKELPPPFQATLQERQSNVKGEIVYIESVNDEKWIVIQTNNGLQTFVYDKDENKTFSVGDIVEVECNFNKITKITLIDEVDEIKKDLSYTLAVTPYRSELGNKVDFDLTVKNDSDTKISRNFTFGNKYDFIVKRDGKEIWRWSDNFNFISVKQNIVLDPDEKITYSENFKPKRTGKYTVEAYFMGESSKKPVATKVFYVTDNNIEEKNLSYKLDILEDKPNLLILKVTNDSKNEFTITTPTSQVNDFLVNKNGEKYWQWSDDQKFKKSEYTLKFAPFETKVYYTHFAPDSKGKYKVYGIFKGAIKDEIVAGPIEIIEK